MKIGPALSLTAIRTLCRDLAERLNDQAGGAIDFRPGHQFFTKRTHELTPVEGDAPGGLSTEYLALAARLNDYTRPIDKPDLLTVLMRTVEAEVTRARIVEGRLIDAIGFDG